MSRHMQMAIEKLKERLLAEAGIVEEAFLAAVRALQERDRELANWVIEHDEVIDQMEVDLEEECLKVLALHQPVATDLRFIIVVLKINNDLERIGDLSANVAERAKYLSSQPAIEIPFPLPKMADKTCLMLKNTLDALVNLDVDRARAVCTLDDDVDDIHRNAFIRVQEEMMKQPHHIDRLIHLLSVSRYLERIADLTTNIADDVIYMADGVIVRHKTEEYCAHRRDRTSRPLPSDGE